MFLLDWLVTNPGKLLMGLAAFTMVAAVAATLIPDEDNDGRQ